MHIAGINWAAVLVAAAAFFAIGYVIHLRLVDLEAWDAAKHNDKEKLSTTRMAAGMILPLATAVGLAVLFSWADVAGARNGMTWGLVIALASGLPVLWYNWFYGTHRFGSSGSTVPTKCSVTQRWAPYWGAGANGGTDSAERRMAYAENQIPSQTNRSRLANDSQTARGRQQQASLARDEYGGRDV